MLDNTIAKYRLPQWVKPYIVEYIKENPIYAIKKGMSFIDVKRKKGLISKGYVELPNGTRFEMNFVANILNQFYYGEKSISEIYEKWSKNNYNVDRGYSDGFRRLSILSKKHMRAIKNLIDGMEMQDIGPNVGTLKLLEFMEHLDTIEGRILSSGLILRYIYAQTFGMIFYKVFYPTAPEFMRSFGKALSADNKTMQWLESELRYVLQNSDHEKNLAFVKNMLTVAAECIDTELPYAKRSGIEKEFLLLRNISIAYPLHIIKEYGYDIDPDTDARLIFKNKKP